MRLVLFFLILLNIFSLNATEEETTQIFEGFLKNQTFQYKDKQILKFVDNEMSQELFTNSNQKIRLKCEMLDKFCDLVAYELSPFREESNLPDWTIKPIPKYVYGDWIAFNPVVSPDGKSLYWTAVESLKKLYLQKVFSSKMTKGDFWQTGKKFNRVLNNQFSSAVLSALPSGKELFVFGNYGEKILINQLNNLFFKERRRLLRYEKNEANLQRKLNRLADLYTFRQNEIYNRVPLYISKKKGKKWLNPKILSFKSYYNDYKIKEAKGEQIIFGGATLSSTGNSLVYSAKHRDSQGKLDLYVSQKNSQEQFPLGENLGNSVNTKDEDTAPFLASDNRTLYFASNRNNVTQLYFTQRIGNSWKKWTTPKKVSKKLRGVTFFSIPAKGNWAYASQNNRLVMIYLPKSFRPNATLIIQGVLQNNNKKPIKGKIFYKSFQDEAHQGYIQTNENGQYAITVPYGQRYDFFAEAPNHFPATQKLDLSNMTFSNQPIKVDFNLKNLAVGSQIKLENIFFNFKKYDIPEESKPELDRLGKFLQKNQSTQIQIQGYTDNVGSAKYNLELSEKRASAVSNYLIEKFNIDKQRIQTIGFGETQPVASNQSEQGREKNRRVIFKILNQ